MNMKELVKNVLRGLHIYHPLQSGYRSIITLLLINYYRITYFKYKGTGFSCNYCGNCYERFVPEFPSMNIEQAINSNEVIAGFGKDVYCPNCRSKNRERLIRAVIENELDFQDKKILHFSPEINLSKYLKIKSKEVISVDLEPEFYRPIDKGIIKADATKLQFESESFDIVIANHILEHIPEDEKAIGEMYRVLKRGGLAILQVPYSEKLKHTIEERYINDPQKQERLFGQKDHVRIYALSDYLERLKRNGFMVKILSPEHLQAYKKYAIQEKESVILCYK